MPALTSVNQSDDVAWERLRAEAQTLFKPKTPIDDDKLFAGRIQQINDVLDAVYEEGGHAIIFGERGVGKTSLSRIIAKKVAPVFERLRTVSISCSKGDDFYHLWGNLINELSGTAMDRAKAYREQKSPYGVYKALEQLSKDHQYIFIFDEFDQLGSGEALSMMADLIKHFSNHPITMTVIIVGVGETLADLFESHESIARCCAQVKMPRMSQEELDEIMDERLQLINFAINDSVREQTRKLSQGLPGYMHLLGQLMLKSAVARRSRTLERADFDGAIAQALEKSDHTARQAYLKAVTSPRRDSTYKEVLLACALAKSDGMGHFYAGDVRAPYSDVRGRQMEITNFATTLNNLCSLGRGPALIKTGQRKRYQYRFANPLVQPLTIMQGVNEGLIKFE